MDSLGLTLDEIIAEGKKKGGYGDSRSQHSGRSRQSGRSNYSRRSWRSRRSGYSGRNTRRYHGKPTEVILKAPIIYVLPDNNNTLHFARNSPFIGRNQGRYRLQYNAYRQRMQADFMRRSRMTARDHCLGGGLWTRNGLRRAMQLQEPQIDLNRVRAENDMVISVSNTANQPPPLVDLAAGGRTQAPAFRGPPPLVDTAQEPFVINADPIHRAPPPPLVDTAQEPFIVKADPGRRAPPPLVNIMQRYPMMAAQRSLNNRFSNY